LRKREREKMNKARGEKTEISKIDIKKDRRKGREKETERREREHRTESKREDGNTNRIVHKK
jgi:hypothetical protein